MLPKEYLQIFFDVYKILEEEINNQAKKEKFDFFMMQSNSSMGN